VLSKISKVVVATALASHEARKVSAHTLSAGILEYWKSKVLFPVGLNEASAHGISEKSFGLTLMVMSILLSSLSSSSFSLFLYGCHRCRRRRRSLSSSCRRCRRRGHCCCHWLLVVVVVVVFFFMV
jgi:hypothetical protein